jgi:Bacterial protein of unknown function (DUF885)
MQQGLKAGLTPPRVLMDRVPAQIAAQVVSEATQSPFYRPLLKLPDTVAATERADLQRQAQALIREQIVPAFSRLQRYLADEYLPRTRTSIAATGCRARARVLRLPGRLLHHHLAERRADSSDRFAGSGAAARSDGQGQGRGRLQGQHGRVLPAPAP